MFFFQSVRHCYQVGGHWDIPADMHHVPNICHQAPPDAAAWQRLNFVKGHLLARFSSLTLKWINCSASSSEMVWRWCLSSRTVRSLYWPALPRAPHKSTHFKRAERYRFSRTLRKCNALDGKWDAYRRTEISVRCVTADWGDARTGRSCDQMWPTLAVYRWMPPSCQKRCDAASSASDSWNGHFFRWIAADGRYLPSINKLPLLSVPCRHVNDVAK